MHTLRNQNIVLTTFSIAWVYLYYISYTLSFWYIMYYIVSEIYIGIRFLKDDCYFQQIIYAAKEFLIPYNFTQRAPETQNL